MNTRFATYGPPHQPAWIRAMIARCHTANARLPPQETLRRATHATWMQVVGWPCDAMAVESGILFGPSDERKTTPRVDGRASIVEEVAIDQTLLGNADADLKLEDISAAAGM